MGALGKSVLLLFLASNAPSGHHNNTPYWCQECDLEIIHVFSEQDLRSFGEEFGLSGTCLPGLPVASSPYYTARLARTLPAEKDVSLG